MYEVEQRRSYVEAFGGQSTKPWGMTSYQNKRETTPQPPLEGIGVARTELEGLYFPVLKRSTPCKALTKKC